MDLRRLKEDANQLLAKGKLPQAEALLREALKSTPHDAQLQIRLAETLRRLNRNAEALAVYRKASELLAEEGHFVRAIAALKVALEIQPGNVDVVSELIQLEVKKARRAGGTGSWEKLAPTPLEQAIDYELQVQTDPGLSTALVVQHTAPAIVQKATPVPEPVADPGVQVVKEELPVRYPQIRRLSDREFAIKSTAQSRWLLVSAEGPLTIRFVEDIEQDHVRWEG